MKLLPSVSLIHNFTPQYLQKYLLMYKNTSKGTQNSEKMEMP